MIQLRVIDPVTDDELVYRRVSVNSGWYDPTTGRLDSQAFAPHKTADVTGLSVTRAKYKTAAAAAAGQPGKSYFVIALQVRQLRANGIIVEARPLPDDPGHAELPQLNSSNRKDSITLERQRMLSNLFIRVEGPFTSPAT